MQSNIIQAPPSDDIDKQLADLERQGGSMARLAHVCAGVLLLVFSAGSLISLSYAALQTLIRTWQAGHGVDIPNAIDTAVNPLLVVAMDVAMLYAASVLRVLVSGRAPREEMRVHIWIIAGASLLESATYLYMTWQFDRPQNGWLWVIAVGRALAAPLFAVYLSMARPLPVAPRDVAYHTSLHSGRGMIRDVATLAADPNAPLHRKVRIYSASSRMTPQDAQQFAGIIEAVGEDRAEDRMQDKAEDRMQDKAPAAATTEQPVHFRAIGEPQRGRERLEHAVDPGEPSPTGQPVSRPIYLPGATYRAEAPEPGTAGDALAALVDRADAMRSNVRRPLAARPATMALVAPAKRQPAPRCGDVGMSQDVRRKLAADRERAARKAYSANPGLSVRELAGKVAMATKHTISHSTAQTLMAQLRDETLARETAQDTVQARVAAGGHELAAEE